MKPGLSQKWHKMARGKGVVSTPLGILRRSRHEAGLPPEMTKNGSR